MAEHHGRGIRPQRPCFDFDSLSHHTTTTTTAILHFNLNLIGDLLCACKHRTTRPRLFHTHFLSPSIDSLHNMVPLLPCDLTGTSTHSIRFPIGSFWCPPCLSSGRPCILGRSSHSSASKSLMIFLRYLLDGLGQAQNKRRTFAWQVPHRAPHDL